VEARHFFASQSFVSTRPALSPSQKIVGIPKGFAEAVDIAVRLPQDSSIQGSGSKR
jgi:hypothetical protein